MDPYWRFFLAESFEAGLPHLCELVQARQKRLDLALSKAGSLTFSAPISDPRTQMIESIKTCVKAVRYSDVSPDGKICWSGPVISRQGGSFLNDNINISCAGWRVLFDYREVEVPQLVYQDTEAGQIIFNLIDHVNSHADSSGVPGSAASPITKGTFESSQIRDRTYTQTAKIGTSIDELVEVESGVDWHIDPETLEFNVYEKLQTDRPGIVMGYNWGPSNLQDVEPNEDGLRLRNHIFARGQSGAPGEAFDDVSIATYSKFMETASLSDVQNPGILAAYAAGEVAVLSKPLLLYMLKPFPNQTHNLFEDYFIGDRIRFSAIKEGWPDIIKQPIRVFGAQITIDEEGNEKIDNITTSL